MRSSPMTSSTHSRSGRSSPFRSTCSRLRRPRSTATSTAANRPGMDSAHVSHSFERWGRRSGSLSCSNTKVPMLQRSRGTTPSPMMSSPRSHRPSSQRSTRTGPWNASVSLYVQGDQVDTIAWLPSGVMARSRNVHACRESRGATPKGGPYLHSCWSGRRDSNPRPSPWQGDALPAEPRPRGVNTIARSVGATTNPAGVDPVISRASTAGAAPAADGYPHRPRRGRGAPAGRTRSRGRDRPLAR